MIRDSEVGSPEIGASPAPVNFSVAFWIKFTGAPGDLPFLCNNDFSYGGKGLTLAPSYNQGAWSWYINDAAAADWGGIGLYAPIQNTLNDGNWHHLVGVQTNKSSRELFVDGISRGMDTTTLGTVTLDKGTIGAQERMSVLYYLPGGVDEVRISNTARDACWIKTDYNNQNNPGDVGSPGFYSVGSEDSLANALGLCLHAARLIFKSLPRAVGNGRDMEARERMSNAPTCAGLGFGNAMASMAHGLGALSGQRVSHSSWSCCGPFLAIHHRVLLFPSA